MFLVLVTAITGNLFYISRLKNLTLQKAIFEFYLSAYNFTCVKAENLQSSIKSGQETRIT